MKNLLVLIVALELFTAIISAAFAFRAGQEDAVRNMEPWILETEAPDGADYLLHIHINDQWYTCPGYIG